MGNWEANIRKVVPYVPGEQPKEQDIIKLNTNENPYPPAPEVLNKQVELENLRLYPDPAATKLVDAIAEYHGVDKNQVFVGVGSDDVLAMSFMTFFNSGKPIFFPDITYSFYDVWADMLRIPYETKPLDADFRIKASDYYGENGGVVFPNPNAPTGIAEPVEFVRDIVSHNHLQPYMSSRSTFLRMEQQQVLPSTSRTPFTMQQVDTSRSRQVCVAIT